MKFFDIDLPVWKPERRNVVAPRKHFGRFKIYSPSHIRKHDQRPDSRHPRPLDFLFYTTSTRAQQARVVA